jgi:cell division transport system ATP-binding protein
VIRLEGVSFSRGGRAVLTEANLLVNRGELVVVLGPRGAGKSVLLAIAAARQTPDRGSVWVSSRNVGDLQRASLPLVRRNLSYLPAPAPLLAGESALENVMLALAVRGVGVDESEARARQALERVGLGERADRLVRTFGAGDRQLTAIARALVGAPAVAVLDEPAAGLGGDDRERVLAVLCAARDEGTTLLSATSDESLAHAFVQRGARRVRIAEGRLAGQPLMALVPESESGLIERAEARRQGSS